jgi:hypothetical protein
LHIDHKFLFPPYIEAKRTRFDLRWLHTALLLPIVSQIVQFAVIVRRVSPASLMQNALPSIA